MSQKIKIRSIATGVPGLDAILGGGLPEFSFNLILGPPGAGKTTLAQQIMFAQATPERPAIYFTVLGEPPMKMLRYQQQFSFFDLNKLNQSIRFINLSEVASTGNYDEVLARIMQEVEAYSPAMIFVDSFRSVMLEAGEQPKGTLNLPNFVHQLGIQLSCWQATTFLIGEYPAHSHSLPIFTVADGLLALSQNVHRNSMVRQIHVLKMRGQPTSPGLHTFRITDDGLQIFPSAVTRDDPAQESVPYGSPYSAARLSMGVPHLDEMLGGGLPSRYSLLIAGPSGSGKTVLATAFLVEGVRLGEKGIIVAFEQTPSQSRTRVIDQLVQEGKIGLINTRALDLSIDEIVARTTALVHEMKATRVVIDSLSGFELAIAPTFREDFRESLARMIAALSGLGVTVMMTSELEDRYTDLRFSPYGSAFLTDAIIVQRYIELDSRLQRVMAVVKVRASAHSNELRQYEITADGIVIGKPIVGYEGILGGRPTQLRASGKPD